LVQADSLLGVGSFFIIIIIIIKTTRNEPGVTQLQWLGQLGRISEPL